VVEIARLHPTTCSTEPMHKRFLPQSLLPADILQPFFKSSGCRTLIRSGFRLMLRTQQLGFQYELGFLHFLCYTPQRPPAD
jgi:hypothetical protein